MSNSLTPFLKALTDLYSDVESGGEYCMTLFANSVSQEIVPVKINLLPPVVHKPAGHRELTRNEFPCNLTAELSWKSSHRYDFQSHLCISCVWNNIYKKLHVVTMPKQQSL